MGDVDANRDTVQLNQVCAPGQYRRSEGINSCAKRTGDDVSTMAGSVADGEALRSFVGILVPLGSGRRKLTNWVIMYEVKTARSADPGDLSATFNVVSGIARRRNDGRFSVW